MKNKVLILVVMFFFTLSSFVAFSDKSQWVRGSFSGFPYKLTHMSPYVDLPDSLGSLLTTAMKNHSTHYSKFPDSLGVSKFQFKIQFSATFKSSNLEYVSFEFRFLDVYTNDSQGGRYFIDDFSDGTNKKLHFDIKRFFPFFEDYIRETCKIERDPKFKVLRNEYSISVPLFFNKNKEVINNKY